MPPSVAPPEAQLPPGVPTTHCAQEGCDLPPPERRTSRDGLPRSHPCSPNRAPTRHMDDDRALKAALRAGAARHYLPGGARSEQDTGPSRGTVKVYWPTADIVHATSVTREKDGVSTPGPMHLQQPIRRGPALVEESTGSSTQSDG